MEINRSWAACSLFLLLPLLVFGQKQIKERYFASPVKHEIRLSGTFGELRSNHFHHGLDIKSSKGRSGDPIFAAAEGYVSRIKVSRTGFGNAIYIDHPNGYTSVYAHLSSFSQDFENYIVSEQKKSQRFDVDVYPDSSKFIIKKGQEIAKMGNSGRSFGPHLHFEIRETISEAPLNPMRFGIKPEDNIAPTVGNIKVYKLNDKIQEIGSAIHKTYRSKSGQYKLSKDTIRLGAWRTGISIQTFDPMNVNANKNGIYRIQMFVDKSLSYEILLDSISFEDTRYINAHIDYKQFKASKIRYNRCFKLPGNELPNIYANEESIIKLYKDKARKVEIIVTDFDQNESRLVFFIKRDENMGEIAQNTFNYYLPYHEANIVSQNEYKVFFPEKSLYEDLMLMINSADENSDGYYSKVLHLGNEDIPLHRYIKLYVLPKTIPSHLKSKICLVSCNESQKMKSYGGDWEDEYFISHVNAFGNYTLTVDTIPPTIKSRTDFNKLKTLNKISFTINDNIETAGRAKGLEYKAFIDGSWVLFEYDLKKKRITHQLTTPATGESHDFLLEVTDDRGNKSIFQKNFIR